MRTKTPLQEKTPFALDDVPLGGIITHRAGLSCVSRVVRSLGLAKSCDAHLPIKRRNRGYKAGQQVEALVLLHAAGGDCKDDMERLRSDAGITKMLGYQVPGARCVGDFLELFHEEEKIEHAREQAQGQERLAFIPEENGLLCGLQRVQRELVESVARQQKGPSTATIDQDATIIESEKRTAQWTYEGTRGYQPMIAVWAETSLVVADEFRDGNVPAQMGPLRCAKAAFDALPDTVDERYFRGDSACHESELVNWLRDEQRPDGPQGFIGFAISARMSPELAQALRQAPESRWHTFGKEADGTLRQWAEVDFVPSEKVEKKNIQPLRYVGLRLLKPQGELFGDGHDRRYHAVLTNIWDRDGAWVINWHREKAGTVEHVHEELKNGLGAGQLPSGKFGANAAWLRIACIAYNVLSALRQAWPDKSMRTAKPKRLRFMIFNVTGRFVRDRRKIRLRFAAPVKWIKQLMKLFERFPLVTRSTG